MNLPRTAISLYVALAIHVLLAFFLALQPAPQWPSGRQIGLSTTPVILSPADRAVLQAASAAAEIIPERIISARTPSPPPSAATSTTTPSKLIGRSASASMSAAPATEVSVDSAGSPRVATAEASNHERHRDGESVDTVDVHPATPPARDEGGASPSYLSDLRQHLANYRRSLPLERVAAVAIIDVLIQADGRLARVHLAAPSGISALDQEALDLIHRAQPLPSPPGGRPIRLSIPIQIHQADRYAP